MVPISAFSCAAVLRALYSLVRHCVPLLLFAVLAAGASPGHAQTSTGGPTVRPMAPPPPSEEGTNNAAVNAQSVPSVMITGRRYDVWVEMRNGGSWEWSSGTGYVLASRSPDWNTTWGDSQIGLGGATVPYWGVHRFNFAVTAPSAPGTYTFEWGMYQAGRGWFGYTSPLAITVREPINNAELMGQNVPSQVRTGQRHEVAIAMRNNGETTWTRAQQYTLMAQSPHNNTTWGLNRVPLPVEAVYPGESTTFRFEVTAPATAGQYVSQWGMQREGHGSFGGSSVPVTVNVTEPVNNAQPTGQSVPAQMVQGKPYTVSVTMVNNGETTWNRAQQYTLMSQSPHNNTTWGFNRVPLPVDNIAPGQSATFTFQVTAPNAPGSYPFQWGMQREGYGAFGPGTAPVSVNVVVPWNDAQVVSMSVPPVMQTGKPYNVAVTMLNNGATTWTPGVYNLGSRNPTDNLIWGPGRVAIATAVAPGQQYTFNFQVTAPAAGDYVMQWGVLSQVEWFGALASSAVTVTEDLSRVTFIHTDGLGSPVARTDGAGTVLSRTRYEPYGYVAAGVTPTIGFTGHVNDADTGLTYMQQRYYDPVAGRFLSVDPVTTDTNTGGSFNRYTYGKNNPYLYIDPDGRNALTKFVKQTIVHNGNIVESVIDVAGDVVTVFHPASTPWNRIEAAISLVSPVDVGDVKAAKNLITKAGGVFRGRKGGASTRAQNKAIAEKIQSSGGATTAGFGNKEQHFPSGSGDNKGGRFSDGSAIDANGQPFQVQTVDTKADGSLTAREADAARDISNRAQQPVVCVGKVDC